MMLKFLPLVRASYKRNKARSIVFSLFILFCVICILLTVSVILPMWSNMEAKINNHPYNVELTALLAESDSETPKRIENLEHVKEVHYSPDMISVIDVDDVLGGHTNIAYLHNGYVPEMTAGHAVESGEKNAAIIAQTIKIRDSETQRTVDLDCTKLIGKTLSFVDEEGNKYSIKIVGTYSVTDPVLSSDAIYTTYEQMLEYDKNVPHDRNKKQYSIVVDHASNRDAVEKECGEFADVFFASTFKIDVENYNIALIVLLCVLAAFLIMVIIGTSVFVSSCIGGRTNELALYRSLGYKTKHIFTIIFSEYLFNLVASMIVATAISVAASRLIIDPYLDSLLGESIMAMHSQIGAVNVLTVFLAFFVIILAACINATRRTGKIGLSVLLKER